MSTPSTTTTDVQKDIDAMRKEAFAFKKAINLNQIALSTGKNM